MKVIVFGSTGGTGKEIIKQSLVKGYEVTAFVRNPAKLDLTHKNLEVVKGDALNYEDVKKAITKDSVVMSSLGVTKKTPTNICSKGTENIIRAMKEVGAKRLIVQSAYSTKETNKGIYPFLLRLIAEGRIADKERMEEIVEKSSLDYTIILPPILTNGRRTEDYRNNEGLNLRGFNTISRADVADFMIRCINNKNSLKKKIVVSY